MSSPFAMEAGFDADEDFAGPEFVLGYSPEFWPATFQSPEILPESIFFSSSSQGYDQPLLSPSLDWPFGQEPSAFPPFPPIEYFDIPPAETWNQDNLLTAANDDASDSPQVPKTQPTMLRPRPVSASDSGLQNSQSLTGQLSLSSRRSPGAGKQGKTRGRRGCLLPAARREAAATRHLSSCVFHKVKRVKCTGANEALDCDACVQANRPCFRYARLKNIEEILRAGDNTLVKPLLDDVVSAPSSLSLRFEINITGEKQWLPTFSLDLRPPIGARSDTKRPNLGELDNAALLEFGNKLLLAVGVERWYPWDGGKMDIPTAVWECMSRHIILKLIPAARYSTSGNQTEAKAVKRFIATLVNQLIRGLRQDMLGAIKYFRDCVDGKMKLAEDPGHCRFARGFAALCRVLDDMAHDQSCNRGANILNLAACGGVFQAEALGQEIRSLGHAFNSIKDFHSGRDAAVAFEKMVKEAFPPTLDVGLSIVLDPAKSESSLALEGQLDKKTDAAPKQSQLPDFISKSDVFTSQTLHKSLPVGTLFSKTSTSASVPNKETNFFQYQNFLYHGTPGVNLQEGSEEVLNTLPLRRPASSDESSSTELEGSSQGRPGRQSNSRKRSGSPISMERRRPSLG